MTLFRFIYLRDHARRCITFPAQDFTAAEAFASAWIARNKRFWKDCAPLCLLPFTPGVSARRAALLQLQLSLKFT